MGYIQTLGFESISIQKERSILIPDDILNKYLNAAEMEAFKNGETGIFSISVFAQKPGQKQEKQRVKTSELIDNTCAPGSGCC